METAKTVMYEHEAITKLIGRLVEKVDAEHVSLVVLIHGNHRFLEKVVNRAPNALIYDKTAKKQTQLSP